MDIRVEVGDGGGIRKLNSNGNNIIKIKKSLHIQLTNLFSQTKMLVLTLYH